MNLVCVSKMDKLIDNNNQYKDIVESVMRAVIETGISRKWNEICFQWKWNSRKVGLIKVQHFLLWDN